MRAKTDLAVRTALRLHSFDAEVMDNLVVKSQCCAMDGCCLCCSMHSLQRHLHAAAEEEFARVVTSIDCPSVAGAVKERRAGRTTLTDAAAGDMDTDGDAARAKVGGCSRFACAPIRLFAFTLQKVWPSRLRLPSAPHQPSADRGCDAGYQCYTTCHIGA